MGCDRDGGGDVGSGVFFFVLVELCRIVEVERWIWRGRLRGDFDWVVRWVVVVVWYVGSLVFVIYKGSCVDWCLVVGWEWDVV